MAQERETKYIEIEIENTPEGWSRLSGIEQGIHEVTVSTRIDGELDNRQLFSLRYCFIELDRLEHDRGPVALTLHVSAASQEDAFRIQHYLAVMTTFRNVSLDIFAEDTHTRQLRSPSVDFYRIMPLFCASINGDAEALDYLDAVGPGDIEETRELIRAGFQQTTLEDAAFGGSVRAMLNRSLVNNLLHLQQDMSGSPGESMQEPDKAALRKELAETLKREMPRLGMLARLLWSLFLRSLSDSKDLFYRDKKRRWRVNAETLRCTQLDAVSYAEGILQLIENACIHSEMKRSYISIRLSDIDITGSGVMRVAKAAQTRVEIYERQKQFLSEKPDPPDGEGRPEVSEYELERQARFCLDFSVLNDSTSVSEGLMGITKMFAKNRKMDWRDVTLEKAFSYQCEKMSDISRHYGLRLLEKTVQLNGGFFSVRSPGADGEQERYGSFFSNSVRKIYYRCPGSQDPCTDFNVLLPLYPHWHSIPEPEETNSPPEKLFQAEALERGPQQQKILRFQAQALAGVGAGGGQIPFFRAENYLSEPEAAAGTGWRKGALARMDWLRRKDSLVKRICTDLHRQTEEQPETDLYLLDLMQVWDVLSLELLAKAVFLLVAWWKNEEKEDRKLALLLPDEMFISEFIRIFSIFYDKQLSGVQWMGTTQIALCGYRRGGDPIPQVLFLLAGETSGSARTTARVFSYYNTGSLLELIPQIRYLTRTEQSYSTPQFPFDLFLTAMPESRKDSGQTPWFIREMEQKLYHDLWQRPHGCCIRGIHVRLHSNIYLADFYEAELLFHNVGIIYRFAHLIVRDLLQQLPQVQERPLVVVGYGFYSSVLVEQIARLLEDWGTVHYMIYSTEQAGVFTHFSPQLKAMDERSRTQLLKNAEYVTVLPIGTTMSTLYQINREITARWGGRFPYDNYVLILVADNGDKALSQHYWHVESPGCVTLEPQQKNEPGLQSRYYLMPLTEWSQGGDNKGVDEQVLVYVDQSSTRPKEIFVVEDSHFKGISHFLRVSAGDKENTRRLELLRGLVQYGHIAEGNNHFQFYFDIEQYFFRARQADPEGRRKTVDAWLRDLRKKIDPNAYNIIVSPLHHEDSPFAKAVIDQVFEHSLRFLHLDMASTFREDVRAKFSYIADEYRQIRQFDRSKPVNVYFVNMVITSGRTLARARSLMTMLLEESGVEYDRESIFKGCFVLVNRSAYDTINSYVKDPDEHFFAYLHLAVPSFNVRQDRCPTCELLDQYRALEYSSAGNVLGQEFRRLRVKSAKRTKQEHRAWLEEMAMDRGGYAGWLRQWLYTYVRQRRKVGGKLWAGIFEVDEATYADLNALYRLLQWGMREYLAQQRIAEPGEHTSERDRREYLKAINAFSLNRLAEMTEADADAAEKAVGPEHLHCLKPEYWKRVVLDYVCAQKNYLRLAASHQTFLKMDTMTKTLTGDIPARGRQTARVLAELMETTLKQAGTRQLEAEWLISYLKVLSRPHLAQYHHIRQGILTLMLPMAAYAVGASDSLPDHLSFARPFLDNSEKARGEMILVRYQVLQTLLKRLASLQSTYFLHGENMERVWDTFIRLRESFFSLKGGSKTVYRQFNPIPTQEQVERHITKLVKWASSCGDDENGCYLIEESFLGKEGG